MYKINYVILAIALLQLTRTQEEDKVSLGSVEMDWNHKQMIMGRFNVELQQTWCPPNQTQLYCPGAKTCCVFSQNRYGCCFYDYGLCCSDGSCASSTGKC